MMKNNYMAWTMIKYMWWLQNDCRHLYISCLDYKPVWDGFCSVLRILFMLVFFFLQHCWIHIRIILLVRGYTFCKLHNLSPHLLVVRKNFLIPRWRWRWPLFWAVCLCRLGAITTRLLTAVLCFWLLFFDFCATWSSIV